MSYDIRNVLSDKKKLTIIAGVTVVGLTIGSVGLKVHQEKVNPSTPPVSADEVDSKDKMLSQLKTENKKLDAQKTKSNNSSNELVPYNLNGRLGSLGGGYNSTPLSLGGGYNYTPTLEPTVYEPIVEPVEDEPVIEFDVPTGEELDTPIVEPIVNEAVAPPVIAPTAPNEEKVEEGVAENNVLDIINSATYKGKRIVFFVEKYLQCKPTYDYLEENGKQILTVNGNGLFIRFEKVGGGDYECTKITLNGQDRRDLLDTIFELNEGTSGYVPSTPPEPSIIETPAPEQPPVKDDKVETEDNVVNPDNTGVTAPPPVVAPPAPTAPEEQEVVVG